MTNNENMNKVTLRLAIAWGILFSFNALASCVMASLTHVKWSTLDFQDQLLICLAIFGNWSTVIMAFLSKTVARLSSGQPPPTNGTDLFSKAPDGTVTKVENKP